MAGGLEDHLKDLLQPLGGVSFRRMFGGVGIFREGVMFAMISSEGTPYFKVDATNEPAYVAESCERFSVVMRGKQSSMPYCRVPERLLDEPEEFAQWAADAYAAAERDRKPKKKSRKK